jgi:excisionase family DNA binding protein
MLVRAQMTNKPKAVAENWISTTEAARLTGYTVRYVQKLAREGIIVGEKITPRAWLINRESLLAYKEHMEEIGTEKFNPRRNPEWIESKRGKKKQ